MAFRSEAMDLCQITEDWFLPLKSFGLVRVLLKRDGLMIWCHISSDVVPVMDHCGKEGDVGGPTRS